VKFDAGQAKIGLKSSQSNMPEQKQHRALLAVEDERACSVLRGYLRSRDDILEVARGAELAEAVRETRPCLVFLEVRQGDRRLASLRLDFPDTPIVAVVPPLAEIGFEAARCGAAGLLTLPLMEDEIDSRLSGTLRSLACSCRGTVTANDKSASSLSDLPPLFHFNSSPSMMRIRGTIEKVASTSATVLIRGESGVGKEIAARMIFQHSERRDKPFVKVNCAAIPHELLESELFGYEVGAFTGAHRSKPGKFDLANGGTVFLDEIAEMHPALQAKLLHVLQDGEFARLGSKRDTSVDVRVICATNRQLEMRVAEGLFREDLLYRVNVVTVNIPPLRERRTEIPALIRYFLDRYSAAYQRPAMPFDNQAMEAINRYHWPGNIRELENFCKRYVIVGDATSMVRELQPKLADSSPADNAQAEIQNGDTAPLVKFPVPAEQEPSLLEIGRQAAWQAEREAIENMLAATHWNRREAARRLQVSYKALLNKIKQIENDKIVKIGQIDAQ
jgi:two-component system, NtrC family, response regulator AtoC